jgi:hypothetical protein
MSAGKKLGLVVMPRLDHSRSGAGAVSAADGARAAKTFSSNAGMGLHQENATRRRAKAAFCFLWI